MLRFLNVFYTNQNIRIHWGSYICQRCIPFIDERLFRLPAARLGCYIGNIYCGTLGYADDITLLARTLSDLKYTVPIRLMAPATIYFKHHFPYSSMHALIKAEAVILFLCAYFWLKN